MSMLAAQVARLRNIADNLSANGYADYSRELRHAADTIAELRNRLTETCHIELTECCDYKCDQCGSGIYYSSTHPLHGGMTCNFCPSCGRRVVG